MKYYLPLSGVMQVFESALADLQLEVERLDEKFDVSLILHYDEISSLSHYILPVFESGGHRGVRAQPRHIKQLYTRIIVNRCTYFKV